MKNCSTRRVTASTYYSTRNTARREAVEFFTVAVSVFLFWAGAWALWCGICAVFG